MIQMNEDVIVIILSLLHSSYDQYSVMATSYNMWTISKNWRKLNWNLLNAQLQPYHVEVNKRVNRYHREIIYAPDDKMLTMLLADRIISGYHSIMRQQDVISSIIFISPQDLPEWLFFIKDNFPGLYFQMPIGSVKITPFVNNKNKQIIITEYLHMRNLATYFTSIEVENVIILLSHWDRAIISSVARNYAINCIMYHSDDIFIDMTNVRETDHKATILFNKRSEHIDPVITTEYKEMIDYDFTKSIKYIENEANIARSNLGNLLIRIDTTRINRLLIPGWLCTSIDNPRMIQKNTIIFTDNYRGWNIKNIPEIKRILVIDHDIESCIKSIDRTYSTRRYIHIIQLETRFSHLIPIHSIKNKLSNDIIIYNLFKMQGIDLLAISHVDLQVLYAKITLDEWKKGKNNKLSEKQVINYLSSFT